MTACGPPMHVTPNINSFTCNAQYKLQGWCQREYKVLSIYESHRIYRFRTNGNKEILVIFIIICLCECKAALFQQSTISTQAVTMLHISQQDEFQVKPMCRCTSTKETIFNY